MQEIIKFHPINSEEDDINYWVAKIKKDDFFSSILNSEAFQRLQDISFLGSLDYRKIPLKNKKEERNRAHHSLHVAALAKFISEKRNYSSNLSNHLVAAALLHDIGHPPFSHSAEPSIKKLLGFGHHEMGEEIIKGKEKKIGKSLNKILKKHLDVDFIIDLLNKKVDAERGGDLFSSEINIDTIDGITRTLSYYTKLSANTTLSITTASFLRCENYDKNFLLDDFWLKKDFAYKEIINSYNGIIQDKICEYYFLNECQFLEEDFIKREKSLRSKHQHLFSALSTRKDNTEIPHWIVDCEIDYTDRAYIVNNHDYGSDRYKTKKTKKQFILEKNREAGSDREKKSSIHQQWYSLFELGNWQS